MLYSVYCAIKVPLSEEEFWANMIRTFPKHKPFWVKIVNGLLCHVTRLAHIDNALLRTNTLVPIIADAGLDWDSLGFKVINTQLCYFWGHNT